MKYVVDTSSWQQLFGCYNRSRFPSLWAKFDDLVHRGDITSTGQVLYEIRSRNKGNGEPEWANSHRELFPAQSEAEFSFVLRILAVPQFSHVVPGSIRAPNAPADAFLIARSLELGGILVTQERLRGSRVTIPYICRHFDISCTSLNGLMEIENWQF